MILPWGLPCPMVIKGPWQDVPGPDDEDEELCPFPLPCPLAWPVAATRTSASRGRFRTPLGPQEERSPISADFLRPSGREGSH